MPRNSRFRRRPNNTGTVVKLSGKRRNPYCARVMSDERDIITGKKKQVCIGTFATREETLLLICLTEYRKRLRRECQRFTKYIRYWMMKNSANSQNQQETDILHGSSVLRISIIGRLIQSPLLICSLSLIMTVQLMELKHT